MRFWEYVLLAALPKLLPSALTAAESDAINGVPVEVLARRTVEAAERTITYVRIRPPALPATKPKFSTIYFWKIENPVPAP